MPTRSNFSVDNPNIPCRSGVYIVTDAEGAVIDVGESKHVGKRIRTHDRREWWEDEACGEMRVDVVWTSHGRKKTRLEIERDLRRQLKPRCGYR